MYKYMICIYIYIILSSLFLFFIIIVVFMIINIVIIYHYYYIYIISILYPLYIIVINIVIIYIISMTQHHPFFQASSASSFTGLSSCATAKPAPWSRSRRTRRRSRCALDRCAMRPKQDTNPVSTWGVEKWGRIWVGLEKTRSHRIWYNNHTIYRLWYRIWYLEC